MAGKSGFCWLQVQPQLWEGAETFPSLQEYIKNYGTPPYPIFPSFQHFPVIPAVLGALGHCGSTTLQELLCPKHSQSLNFPTAPRMLRDGCNSLGKPSALPPGIIQGSSREKQLPDLQIPALHTENPYSTRPGGQEFQRLEVAHHGTSTAPRNWNCSGSNFSRMFSAGKTPSKREGDLAGRLFPTKAKF